MNFKKLAFWTTLFTTAAVPLATAQNPVILQGNYISNVFGQSNFVLNPNAQTNTANVTVSNATVTRSATTPLVATSEFNITTSTATGYADWSTRTFDAGMKNQNCEARFSYRGFSVGSTKAQLIQNSLVVAELTLTASTDPRIASINFPCGDLTYGTTFRLQQATASLTGTNEIGGIYVGLATNQANVAQAEEVGTYRVAGVANCNWTRTGAGTNTLGNFGADSDCGDGIVTGAADTSQGKIPGARFNNLKPGKYMFIVDYTLVKQGTTNDNVMARLTDGTTSSAILTNLPNTTTDVYMPATSVLTVEYTTVTSPVIQLQGRTASTTNTVLIYNGESGSQFKIIAYRFPSSSELVVTPERQNVFAGIRGTSNTITNIVSSIATWTKLTASGTLTRVTFGKAKVESNNDYSVTIDNMPVGSYAITATGVFQADASSAGNTTSCIFGISDSVGGTIIAAAQQNGNGNSSLTTEGNLANSLIGIYNNTSVASRSFIVQAYKITGGGNCYAYSDSNRPITISVIPLDQPSNSALYVQGPVKSAGTGDAIAAGYVGEVLESSFGSGGANLPTTNGNTYDINSLTISTPGVYLVMANFSGVDSGQTTPAYIQHYLFDSTNSATIGITNQPIGTGNPATYSTTGNYASSAQSSTVFGYLRVTSSLTIKNRIKRIGANGGAGYVNGDICKIIAVRLN